MGAIKRIIQKYIFTQELPLEVRLVNLVYLVGLVAGLAATIARLFIFHVYIQVFATALITVSTGFMMFLHNRLRLYKLTAYLTVVLLADVLFPMKFLSIGGINSGMAAYFVLSMVVIFLLMRGRDLAILLPIHIVIVTVCYYVSCRFPGWNQPLTDSQRFFDAIESVVISGLFVGIVILFQSSVYETEKQKSIQASKAKSDFLSNMSHEMRTPMNAIIGMTSIGKNSDDALKKDYAFEKIEEASTHLLGVINDILDMSKIEANKLELSITNFDFEKMLRKVTNVVNFRIDERQQNFYVDIDSAIPRSLIGDDQRIAQVVTNLLSNAVKFTPVQGTIRMSAKLIKQEGSMNEIQIEVRDTGIGITPEQQSRLFNSFEQAESGTSRNYGGTGLGLAISKRIVEMMGGTIWVESELGQGSLFAFTFLAESVVSEQPGLLDPGVNWNNVRVLVVDDVPEVLDYFADIARRLGLHCDTAPGSKEALDMISQNGEYDIYFIDWKMPGMDGIELTRHIKANNAKRSVVIMITATEWSLIEVEAKSAGVDKYLQKPLFPSSIADCINECIGLPAHKKDEAGEEAADDFSGRCVLLAEDIDINREILLALLEPTKLVIDCAENGSEAVNMFKGAPDKYDMIFMDVQMPLMDGYAATQAIRALDVPRGSNIPIIAMTANVFREDIEKCLQAGMDGHVGKPLNLEEVLEKLREYLCS